MAQGKTTDGVDPGASPFVNPLDRLLGYQLRRASQALLADLTASIADLALKVTEVSILLVIESNPDITQSDIGRLLSIQRANMAPLTALLIRRKLVRRAGTNGRAHALRLTRSGEELTAECRQRIAFHEQKFLKNISLAEQKALLSQLRIVWQGNMK